MIGGSANSASASRVASPARPYGPNSRVPGKSAVTKTASSANVGIARPMLVMLMARKPPLPRWPSHSASGSPTTSAISSAVTVSSSCCCIRCSMPPSPVQLDQVVR